MFYVAFSRPRNLLVTFATPSIVEEVKSPAANPRIAYVSHRYCRSDTLDQLNPGSPTVEHDAATHSKTPNRIWHRSLLIVRKPVEPDGIRVAAVVGPEGSAWKLSRVVIPPTAVRGTGIASLACGVESP